MRTRPLFTVLLAAALAFGGVGCGDDGTTSTAGTTTTIPPADAIYAPEIDPARFVDTIDNPYLPWIPGTRAVFEGETEDGLEEIVVEVTHDTKVVMGVTCVVVRDVVTLDGEVIEDTLDWYAQDADGNVWYFGEDTKAFENGEVVSTEGSWEAGVDGAQPGIVMLANPQVGDSYRQEFYAGHAEDMADVISVTDSATVPTGTYDDVVTTKDYTPLEPDVLEHKFYARGVGLVLEVDLEAGGVRIELVEVSGE